jgi:3-methyladenine DNA glycosylase AlkD
MLADIQSDLEKLASPKDAVFLQRFFKTGPGEYAAGDRFRGIRVPQTRQLVRKYQALPLEQADHLLQSPFHEDRLLALLILARQFRKADEAAQAAIYRLYLSRSSFINNWDLVDTSAEHIVGAYLFERSRKPLLALARSSMLWERRIAILATFYFIRRGQFEDTLRIADLLLTDEHDLIHKAVGWLLREVGKRDLAVEEGFLKPRYQAMPRTMLRYAIEKFPEKKRLAYLQGRVPLGAIQP